MQDILSCPICFDKYDEQGNKPRLPNTLDCCGHTFCLECIQKLKSKHCPQCRKIFDKINPNYILIEVISAKAKEDKLRNQNEEAKTKLAYLDKYLNEYVSIFEDTKSLIDKNFKELRQEVNLCAEKRLNEILKSQRDLMLEIENLEKEENLRFLNDSSYSDYLNDKIKLWKDSLMRNSLTLKEKAELSSELLKLETKINDCKNVNFFSFSPSYIDSIQLGKVNSFKKEEELIKKTESQLLYSKPSSYYHQAEKNTNDANLQLDNYFSIETFKFSKRKLRGHMDTVHAICFWDNKKLLISGSEDKRIKVWSILTGECVATLESHSNLVSCLCLGLTDTLISGSWDNTIKIWDLKTNKCVKTLLGHSNWIQCICLAQNGQYLISGSFDQTIKIWNLSSFSCIQTLFGHSYWITVLISLNKNKFLSGSRDKTIKLWNLDTFKCERTLIGHENDILSLELLNNSCLASSSGDNTIRIWNLNDGVCLKVFEDVSPVWSLKFLTNNYLISGNEYGDMKLWSLNENKLIKSMKSHASFILGFDLTENNEYLLSYSSSNKLIVLVSNQVNKIIK